LKISLPRALVIAQLTNHFSLHSGTGSDHQPAIIISIRTEGPTKRNASWSTAFWNWSAGLTPISIIVSAGQPSHIRSTFHQDRHWQQVYRPVFLYDKPPPRAIEANRNRRTRMTVRLWGNRIGYSNCVAIIPHQQFDIEINTKDGSVSTQPLPHMPPSPPPPAGCRVQRSVRPVGKWSRAMPKITLTRHYASLLPAHRRRLDKRGRRHPRQPGAVR